MLKVLGRANSSNVMKVTWCCAELGIDVERVDIGGPFGGNDTPEYLAKNPNGTVPTIEDGDFVLWESNAIVRYLAEAYGGEPWFPADARRRALANQWMDWTATTINPPMTTMFIQLVRTQADARDMDAVEAARKEAGRRWAMLDAHLGARDYVIGAEPTMADIPLGVLAYRWLHLPIERPALGNLEAWHDRLAARPAYQEHVMLPLT